MNMIQSWWENYSLRHPKLSKWVVQFVKFYAFSLLVTVLQYVMLTFLPDLFYRYTDWCDIPCQLIHLQLGPVDAWVFNYPVTGDATGGMGYFAAFAITLFVAQCVNFPMQRNVTFKSRGNVWYQMIIFFPSTRSFSRKGKKNKRHFLRCPGELPGAFSVPKNHLPLPARTAKNPIGSRAGAGIWVEPFS